MSAIEYLSKDFISERGEILKGEIASLDITPLLVSFVSRKNSASNFYVHLKEKFIKDIGGNVLIRSFEENTPKGVLIKEIEGFNRDKKVNGIMVQTFPNAEIQELIDVIVREKDVDGLRKDSLFLQPTARAVIQIIKEAEKIVLLTKNYNTACVVGATGMVGGPLADELEREGYKVIRCDVNTPKEDLPRLTREADILVSCTGSVNSITGDMIKKEAIVIDVGVPGDVDIESVKEKASIITPHKGSVGPLGILFLAINLFEATRLQNETRGLAKMEV
jgi:methylenetetrahydrofolate dehydrogenase (NADP+)/methenyltetrahydrofolate cyclohydrolase